MHITLIGMSGAGKSHLSNRIGGAGYHVIDCDLLIAQLLQQKEGIDGHSLTDMARWLGLPHQPHYAVKETLFKKYEEQIFAEVIQQATDLAQQQRPCLIDTGGSIIYASNMLLKQLKNLSVVAYLQIPATLQNTLLEQYLAAPRPMVWNNQFNQLPEESEANAYRRCYPQLVAQREHLYEQYADITLPFEYYRDPAVSTAMILDRIIKPVFI